MSSDNKVGWVAGVAAIVLLGGIVWWMNSGYGKVSQEGYQYAMALISICNRKDESRLADLVSAIRSSAESGTITDYDSKALLRITATAESGDWEDAANMVRRLMEDQIEHAPPAGG